MGEPEEAREGKMQPLDRSGASMPADPDYKLRLVLDSVAALPVPDRLVDVVRTAGRRHH